MTFREFKMKVLQSPPGDHIRLGQHAFNVLFSENPKIANRIRGSYSVDPFYEDSNLPAFWRAVERLWQ